VKKLRRERRDKREKERSGMREGEEDSIRVIAGWLMEAQGWESSTYQVTCG
jgi:hypothetical protein